MFFLVLVDGGGEDGKVRQKEMDAVINHITRTMMMMVNGGKRTSWCYFCDDYWRTRHRDQSPKLLNWKSSVTQKYFYKKRPSLLLLGMFSFSGISLSAAPENYFRYWAP